MWWTEEMMNEMNEMNEGKTSWLQPDSHWLNMTLRLQRIERTHKRQGSKPTWRIGEHEGDKVAPVEGRDMSGLEVRVLQTFRALW